MSRTQAYYRHHRFRVINRKKKLAKELLWHYKHAGSFAKGKIHCGCGMCIPKWGRHGPKMSDIIKIQVQSDKIKDYYEGRLD